MAHFTIDDDRNLHSGIICTLYITWIQSKHECDRFMKIFHPDAHVLHVSINNHPELSGCHRSVSEEVEKRRTRLYRIPLDQPDPLQSQISYIVSMCHCVTALIGMSTEFTLSYLPVRLYIRHWDELNKCFTPRHGPFSLTLHVGSA